MPCWLIPVAATLTVLEADGSLIVPAGAALISETNGLANGAIDPGETVTLLFALRDSVGTNTDQPGCHAPGHQRRHQSQGGQCGVSHQHLWRARLAGIHEEIAALPMGYETLLGEGGGGLSGGQQQRVALARAIARRPAALFLDEATSSLDVATEQRVERHLEQLRCTRLVASHRLHAVSKADVIVVLEQGKVVRRGHHRELMAQRGVYFELVTRM